MEIVRRLYSSLKDGGILFINLPAFESLRQRHDVVYGTPEGFKKLGVPYMEHILPPEGWS